MEREDYEAILKAHLDPVNKAITELKESHKDIVNILVNQSRQDETIKHIRADVQLCTKDRDEIFTRLRAIEQDPGNRLWDTMKIILAAGGAFVAALLAMLLGGKT